MNTFYSQFNQDRLINYLFAGKKEGIFLDIGANDGIVLSNTYFFEKEKAWTGVCIEPHPDIFKQLQSNRNCFLENCCITDTDGCVTFRKVSGAANMFSGIVDFMDEVHCKRIEKRIKEWGGSYEDIRVESREINSILDKYSITQIDYCSIDTEGAELQIIQSIDFDKINIKVFSVENFRKKDKSVGAFLKQKKYCRIPSVLDDFYVKGFTFRQRLMFRLYILCCRFSFLQRK